MQASHMYSSSLLTLTLFVDMRVIPVRMIVILFLFHNLSVTYDSCPILGNQIKESVKNHSQSLKYKICY